MRLFCKGRGWTGTAILNHSVQKTTNDIMFSFMYAHTHTHTHSYMSVLLPSLDWSEPYYSSFNNLIARINKLFKKLHEEPNVSLGVESWCFTHIGFQSDIRSWKSHNTNMLLKGQSVYSCVLLCVIAHSLLMHSFVTPESTPGMGQPRHIHHWYVLSIWIQLVYSWYIIHSSLNQHVTRFEKRDPVSCILKCAGWVGRVGVPSNSFSIYHSWLSRSGIQK